MKVARVLLQVGQEPLGARVPALTLRGEWGRPAAPGAGTHTRGLLGPRRYSGQQELTLVLGCPLAKVEAGLALGERFLSAQTLPSSVPFLLPRWTPPPAGEPMGTQAGKPGKTGCTGERLRAWLRA